MVEVLGNTAVSRLLAKGKAELSNSFTPWLDAELLLACTIGVEREDFLLNQPIEINDETVCTYRRLIERRKRFEPVAYITGRKDFFKSTFLVNRSVLIPRPETEVLVEAVLERFGKEEIQVLDIGTGSGCIALSLALERPGWLVTATDISGEALKIARQNARRLDVGNVIFIESDIFESVKGTFDLIVSNPPYVAPDEIETLPPDVGDYEPRVALFAEGGGLSFIKRILKEAPRYLIPGGSLFCEMGFGQKDAVTELINPEIWSDFSFINDLSGNPRVLAAELKHSSFKRTGTRQLVIS